MDEESNKEASAEEVNFIFIQTSFNSNQPLFYYLNKRSVRSVSVDFLQLQKAMVKLQL